MFQRNLVILLNTILLKNFSAKWLKFSAKLYHQKSRSKIVFFWWLPNCSYTWPGCGCMARPSSLRQLRCLRVGLRQGQQLSTKLLSTAGDQDGEHKIWQTDLWIRCTETLECSSIGHSNGERDRRIQKEAENYIIQGHRRFLTEGLPWLLVQLSKNLLIDLCSKLCY